MARLIQVELWTNFISAGGVREAVIPLPQIFSATLSQDIRRSQRDLNLLVDAAVTELLGGGEPLGLITLARTTVGLDFKDSYTRANSPTVGGGWTDTEGNPGGLELESNSVLSPAQPNSNSNRWTRSASAGFASAIFQSIFQDLETFGGHSMIARLDPADLPGTQAFLWQAATAAGTWNIFNETSVVATVSNPLTGFRIQRGVLRDNGDGTSDLSQYDGSVASLTDLSATPSFLQSALGESNGSKGATDHWGGNMQRGGRFDMTFACGVDIVVSGLPAGHQIRLEGVGGPTATEVGGTATLVADGVKLPYLTIQVLNTVGRVVGSDVHLGTGGFPADGWGGGIYAATVITAPDYVPGGERKVIRAIFANGEVDEFRIN